MEIILLAGAAALLYWLQNFLYRRFWDRNLSISIRFQEKPALEGETAHLTEVIENRKILPLSYLNVKFKISRFLRFQNMENTTTSDWNYKNDIFSVLFHQRITRVLPFICEKRGYYQIDQADLISSNLLLTGSLVRTFPQKTAFYVYPKEIDISGLDVPFQKMMGSLVSARFLYEDPFEFRGLRDYVQTDPMNSINWKAWARSGEPMVNLHDSTTSQEAVVFLNLEDETIWKYEQLHEIAIRITSALCERFLRQAIPTRILCNGTDSLSGNSVVLPIGTGIRQINAINEVLARIDLSAPIQSGKDQVDLVLAEQKNSTPLYIMISNCMRRDLYESFSRLAEQSAASLWIAPLYEEMELHLEGNSKLDIVRWEVDHYES